MLKIQLTGSPHEVRSYLYELNTRCQYTIVNQSLTELPHEWSWIGSVQFHPRNRLKTVSLRFKDGGYLHVPMLDVVQCEIKPGVYMVSGGVYEVDELCERELE